MIENTYLVHDEYVVYGLKLMCWRKYKFQSKELRFVALLYWLVSKPSSEWPVQNPLVITTRAPRCRTSLTLRNQLSV